MWGAAAGDVVDDVVGDGISDCVVGVKSLVMLARGSLEASVELALGAAWASRLLMASANRLATVGTFQQEKCRLLH